MGLRHDNAKLVRTHPKVQVKTARKFKGNYTGQASSWDVPVGREPLDTSVSTAGFTVSSRPGYLSVNHRSPKVQAGPGLIVMPM